MLWALKKSKRRHCAAQLNADTAGRVAMRPQPQWSKFLFFRNWQ